ncbi:MAG: acyl-CoA thioesterase [Chitinophagales bacterium]
MTATYMMRVRYAETDQMGFAHHANHLVWFEAARTEFLRTTDCSYADFERAGIFIPVLEASCRYFSPAFYDDVLAVECRAGKLTPARLELLYELRREGELLAEGRTVHAFMGADRRPVNLKKRAPQLWEILRRLAGAEP